MPSDNPMPVAASAGREGRSAWEGPSRGRSINTTLHSITTTLLLHYIPYII